MLRSCPWPVRASLGFACGRSFRYSEQHFIIDIGAEGSVQAAAPRLLQ
jgi:hypothetical protein